MGLELSVKLYSFGYREVRTYLFAALFILGNILAPRLVHLLQQGGVVWLPIYFFTLVGAYKYGWKVGLLTAIFSPILNHLLFGMPSAYVLPSILVKSTLLALLAGYVAQRFSKVSIVYLLAIVVSYQIIGSLFDLAIGRGFSTVLQALETGLPGMALQIFGGYLFIKFLVRK